MDASSLPHFATLLARLLVRYANVIYLFYIFLSIHMSIFHIMFYPLLFRDKHIDISHNWDAQVHVQ